MHSVDTVTKPYFSSEDLRRFFQFLYWLSYSNKKINRLQ